MRREADAFVGVGQAQALAQGAVEKGVSGGRAWPGAFVEAGEDHAVAALQARFQRAEDGDAGVFGRVGGGDHAVHDGLGEVRECARLHPAHGRRKLREIVDELRRHRAGLAGPDACAFNRRRGAERFGETREGFGGRCTVDQFVGEGWVGEIVKLVEFGDEARRFGLRAFERGEALRQRLECR